MVEWGKLQIVSYGIKLVVFKIGIHRARHCNSISVFVCKIPPKALVRRLEEACIKARIVCHKEFCAAAELIEGAQSLLLARCVRNHGIVYSGKLCNTLRNMLFRVYEGAEFVLQLAPDYSHGADFRNAVDSRGKSGGFKVEGNNLTVKGHVACTEHGFYRVVNVVGLHAVNRLEIVVLERRNGVHYIREALNNAVVGNGNSPVPPFVCAPNELVTGRYAVHLGHIGMHMQFKALFRFVVGAVKALYFADIPRTDSNIVGVFIKCSVALHQNSHSRFKRRNVVCIFLFSYNFDSIRTGKVGYHHSYDNTFAVPGLLRFKGKNIAPHNHSSALCSDIAKAHRALLYRLSEQGFHLRSVKRQPCEVKSGRSALCHAVCGGISRRRRRIIWRRCVIHRRRCVSHCRRSIMLLRRRITPRYRRRLSFYYFHVNLRYAGENDLYLCAEFFSDYLLHDFVAAFPQKNVHTTVRKLDFELAIAKVCAAPIEKAVYRHAAARRFGGYIAEITIAKQ